MRQTRGVGTGGLRCGFGAHLHAAEASEPLPPPSPAAPPSSARNVNDAHTKCISLHVRTATDPVSRRLFVPRWYPCPRSFGSSSSPARSAPPMRLTASTSCTPGRPFTSATAGSRAVTVAGRCATTEMGISAPVCAWPRRARHSCAAAPHLVPHPAPLRPQLTHPPLASCAVRSIAATIALRGAE